MCLSPHKFVGGPGTPGVLVAKRALFANPVPTVPSGGTILFVSPTRQSYHPEPAIREEGGTPAIVESIRAGLVFALKEAVGAEEIRRREGDFARRALESLQAQPADRDPRQPGPRAPGDRVARRPSTHAGLLHSNFVVAVLSDLFGIQARSGCFCAGPYIHRMYPIDDDWSERMDAEVARGHMGAKLAFARLSFNYFMSETVFEYILEAVHLVAERGLEAAAALQLRPGIGPVASRRRSRPGAARRWTTSWRPPVRTRPRPRASCPATWRGRASSSATVEARPPRRAPAPALTPDFERIRWFPLPGEALAAMR